jgi:hypothetical protein
VLEGAGEATVSKEAKPLDIGKILLKLKAERKRLDVAIQALSALENERKKKGANKKRYPTLPRTATASGVDARALARREKQLARVIPIRKFGS